MGGPPLADRDPAIQSILFSSDRAQNPKQVRTALADALVRIRRESMTDSDIVAARDHLADFHERWFFEPTYRVFSDHLAAYAFSGHEFESVKDIPRQIRAVEPAPVRRAFDRYFMRANPSIIVLPPAANKAAN